MGYHSFIKICSLVFVTIIVPITFVAAIVPDVEITNAIAAEEDGELVAPLAGENENDANDLVYTQEEEGVLRMVINLNNQNSKKQLSFNYRFTNSAKITSH